MNQFDAALLRSRPACWSTTPKSLPVRETTTRSNTSRGDTRTGMMCLSKCGKTGAWQMQNAIRTTSQVVELLPHAPHEIAALENLEAQYKLAIPPYYFSLIDVADPHDPIRLQSVPSPLELPASRASELEDPLEEDKDSPVPGLTHRYPDRVLMVTTHVCTMYCRFCTRKASPWIATVGTVPATTISGWCSTSASTKKFAT